MTSPRPRPDRPRGSLRRDAFSLPRTLAMLTITALALDFLIR